MTALPIRAATLAAAGLLATAGLAGPAVDGASAASVPACGNHSLAITHTPVDGATGHGAFVLLFRNSTRSACSLHGYPGLDALNSAGHVLAHATRTLHGFAGGASAVRTVTVAPGQFASAPVEWLNFDPSTSGNCTFSKSVATPANTTHTVHLPASVSICRLQVHPTVGGTSGNYEFAQAQTQWIEGASVSSARQGGYWTRAEHDLQVDGYYPTQVGWLKHLIALPDADQTPVQNAAYHRYVKDLDAFFGTPGLYF